MIIVSAYYTVHYSMLKNALHCILHNLIKLTYKKIEKQNNLRELVPEKDGEHIRRTIKWLRNKVKLLTSNPYSIIKRLRLIANFHYSLMLSQHQRSPEVQSL